MFNLTKEIEYLIKNPKEIRRNKFEIKKRIYFIYSNMGIKRIFEEKEILINLIND